MKLKKLILIVLWWIRKMRRKWMYFIYKKKLFTFCLVIINWKRTHTYVICFPIISFFLSVNRIINEKKVKKWFVKKKTPNNRPKPIEPHRTDLRSLLAVFLSWSVRFGVLKKKTEPINSVHKVPKIEPNCTANTPTF